MSESCAIPGLARLCVKEVAWGWHVLLPRQTGKQDEQGQGQGQPLLCSKHQPSEIEISATPPCQLTATPNLFFRHWNASEEGNWHGISKHAWEERKIAAVHFIVVGQTYELRVSLPTNHTHHFEMFLC